jgi:hypothetical protein
MDKQEIEDLRETCPVKREHKSIFPAMPWHWQLGAATWVWAVLKEAGGSAEGSDLTDRLAQVRDWPRKKARGLRNQGLFMLEAFDLVSIERPPGKGPNSAYGRVKIVRESIEV